MEYSKIHESNQIFLDMLNQIFEVEKKLSKIETPHSIGRNINNLKSMFENRLFEKDKSGFVLENPIGQAYNESRTDCEASISGESTENLYIVEVIKPIIRLKKEGYNTIVQRAVVVVAAKSPAENSQESNNI